MAKGAVGRGRSGVEGGAKAPLLERNQDAGAEGDREGAGDALVWLCRMGTWCRLVDEARQRVNSIWLVLGSHCGFWRESLPSPIYILILSPCPQLLFWFAPLPLSDPEPEASKMSLEVSKMPNEPELKPSHGSHCFWQKA